MPLDMWSWVVVVSTDMYQKTNQCEYTGQIRGFWQGFDKLSKGLYVGW